MIGIVFIILGIICAVMGMVAASRGDAKMMKLIIRQKKDEDEQAFLARSKKSSLLVGLVLVAGGVLFNLV